MAWRSVPIIELNPYIFHQTPRSLLVVVFSACFETLARRARAARSKCTLHVVLWRRCPTAIGFAERVSRRLLRKQPRESWLLQNKFTRLILYARRKSKMLVVVMTTKKTTQMKIKLAYETLLYSNSN